MCIVVVSFYYQLVIRTM